MALVGARGERQVILVGPGDIPVFAEHVAERKHVAGRLNAFGVERIQLVDVVEETMQPVSVSLILTQDENESMVD